MRFASQAAVPAISAVLAAASAAGILLETAYRNNSRVEAALCRLQICATGQLIERAQASLFALAEPPSDAWREAREALRRDQAAAQRWCDAAEALLLSGEYERARYGYARAVELAPNSPPILIRAAGFHLRTRHPREALPLTSRILQLIREYDAVVFFFYKRSGIPVEELLRAGIPDDAAAARSFLSYSLDRGSPQDARRVWQYLQARHWVERPLGNRYLGFLLKNRLYPEAVADWAAYAGSSGGDYPRPNRLFNGGFESECLGGPFDWTLSSLDHVREERDSAIARTGKWSLRVTFDGAANLDYHGASQIAVVAPGSYRLRAWIKVAGLTTDQGLFIRVFDPQSPARLDFRTTPLNGTSDWVQAQTTLPVSPATRLVEIQITRASSWKFDNKIAGTAWIDTVELVPLT